MKIFGRPYYTVNLAEYAGFQEAEAYNTRYPDVVDKSVRRVAI